ncbi:MAG: hypothetical protein EGQ00_02465 [Parabacteroides johnsonii]|nr:hypothetical protein [Parabacteroides johnsonii]
MMNKVEMDAADALLDRRLMVNIPAPWWLRMLGKKTFPVYVKRPVYGGLLIMARLTAQMDIDLKKLQEKGTELLFPLIAEQGVTASRIIAHGLLRGQLSHRLLARPLAWYLRWHMNARSMAELAKAIVVTSGAEDFVSITMSEITMKVTTPMMGQPTKEGS